MFKKSYLIKTVDSIIKDDKLYSLINTQHFAELAKKGPNNKSFR